MSGSIHDPGTRRTRWDPNQYLKFSDHRLRPAIELLDRIPLAEPVVIYDLGCGSGNVTRLIARRWPSATVYGVDNSPEMLSKAAAEPSKIRWIQADIQHWQPEEPPDLLYSNAALHWLGGHATLFPRLIGFLREPGCLAVQMPLSSELPSHLLMGETLAGGGSGGSAFGSPELRQAVTRKPVENGQEYYEILADRTRSLDIWETEYVQVLEGENPVLEWVKGTGLRPVLNALDDRERELFLMEYGRRLRLAYPVRADGHTLYPFRRLFIVAII